MIIQCKSCSRKFVVKDKDIPINGREVQCGYCSVTWHQMPISKKKISEEKIETQKENFKNDESHSVDSMKASDGKTYRFLGSQWAEVLPSGKSGRLAKKKISKELNILAGKKEVKQNKIIKLMF